MPSTRRKKRKRSFPCLRFVLCNPPSDADGRWKRLEELVSDADALRPLEPKRSRRKCSPALLSRPDLVELRLWFSCAAYQPPRPPSQPKAECVSESDQVSGRTNREKQKRVFEYDMFWPRL